MEFIINGKKLSNRHFKYKILNNEKIELKFSFIHDGKVFWKNMKINYNIPNHNFDIQFYDNNYMNYQIGNNIYINNPKNIAFIFLQIAKYVRINNIDYILESSSVNTSNVKRSKRNKHAISIKTGPIININGNQKVQRKLIDLSKTNFKVITLYMDNKQELLISI